jgi:PAS domain S-box-containing protein
MECVRNRRPWNRSNLNPTFRSVLVACAVGTLCYLAGRLAGALMLRPQMVWPLWLGCALLVSILLLAPRRLWPIIIASGLAAFIVYDLSVGLTIGTTALLILSDAVEVLIAALGVIFLLGGAPRLNSVKALAKYSLFAVILAPLCVALIDAAIFPGRYWVNWRIIFFSEAIAFLTVTPAVLSWSQRPRAWAQNSRQYYAEAAVLIATLAVLGYMTFASSGKSSPALLYSLLPFLLWSALRFGSTGVGAAIIVVAFVAILGAVHGRGPFTGQAPLDNVLSLQLFLLLTVTSFMVLAVVVEEHNNAERSLKKSEEQFSKAFRESPLILTLTSARDQRYLEVNETFERTTGYRREEVIGRTPLDIGLWVDDSSQLTEITERILQEGSLRELPIRVRVKDGDIRIGLASAELIEIGGEPCVLGVTADVTDHKRAEDHFRLAVESAPNGMVIVNKQGRIVLVNSQTEKLFGYQREQLLGQSIEILVPEFLRERPWGFGTDFFANPQAHAMGGDNDLQGLRKDGTRFPVEIALNAMETNEGIQILGSIVDTTERKRADQALRESEERFRAVANKAPVLIWMSGPDKLRTFFNQGWRDFTGRAMDQELGEGWISGVHPDDLDHCLGIYSSAFELRTDFNLEFRLRRFDGEYRWILDYGVPRLDPDGTFRGYIGSCIDITDRKLAEESLRELGGRLIATQEEERTRIARELHDDVSQRIALIEISLEQFGQDTPGLSPEATRQLQKIVDAASDVSSDIHNLSHQLHPLKLDILGLVAAINSYCMELSEQHGLEVHFLHHNVPQNVPKDVTLCSYRIVQESLRNAVKHSGCEEVTVELSGHSSAIDVRISDSGKGFDVDSPRARTGLGLVSMKERLRPLGGKLNIKSQLRNGTTIEAHIPFSKAAMKGSA